MTDHITEVVGWVKDAFPGGVGADDAAPLLAVLRQRVGSTRTLQVCLQLVADGILDASAAAQASTPKAPVPQGDLRRVAAQLVLAGWPLADATDDDESDVTEEGSYLGRIVAWLRDGYPQGVPEHDYVPLFALLNRRLTRGEVKEVAKALRRASIAPAGPGDIAEAISGLTNTEATERDIERVRARLAAKGWPVDFPDPDATPQG